jgi:hypothetical protein
VKICTQYAQRGMINIFVVIFCFALALPFFDPYFFIGYLIGMAFFGLFQAIFMANAGGAWDNAKKIVETDLRQKNTPLHAATVVGDTVGDPFKDTSSVSLNPVIKFTTLFGLLAVEIAVKMADNDLKYLWSAPPSCSSASGSSTAASTFMRHSRGPGRRCRRQGRDARIPTEICSRFPTTVPTFSSALRNRTQRVTRQASYSRLDALHGGRGTAAHGVHLWPAQSGRANATIWFCSRWFVQNRAPSKARARAANGMRTRSSIRGAAGRGSTRVSQ